MSDPTRDWLKVIYRPQPEADGMAAGGSEAGAGGAGGVGETGGKAGGKAGGSPGPDQVAVRTAPLKIDPESFPGREQRVRVSVVPGAPGLEWRLYLVVSEGGGEPGSRRVWWRPEPGSWERATRRTRVAAGRGRGRLDFVLRVEGVGGRGPRLAFEAEAGG